MKPTIHYRGFDIIEVFHYSNGTSDFEVYPENQETGWMEHGRTIEQVKIDIDDKIADNED